MTEVYVCSRCGAVSETVDSTHQPPIIWIPHQPDCEPPRALRIEAR